MPRYFVRPTMPAKSWYEYEPDTWPERSPPNLTVYDARASDTGLVDESGSPIMRGTDPIGFLGGVKR